MFRIGYATVDGANGGALRFFVKPHALRAFIRDDIIEFFGYGRL